MLGADEVHTDRFGFDQDSTATGGGPRLVDVPQDFGSTGCDDFDDVHGQGSNLTLNTLSMKRGQRPTRDVVAENIDGAGQAHESDGSARLMTTR